MNISETQYLYSSISHNRDPINPDDLFYIGTGIGLATGVLCASIIAYSNYIKKKRDLESVPIEISI
jgi:hypothetical protein